MAERPAMTNHGFGDPAPASSSARRPAAGKLLTLVLGRDAAQARGDDAEPGPARETLLPPGLQLVMLSFLMLFVELALIRWSGALVIYLSYFSNFVLMGSFLGIGIGFLRSKVEADLLEWLPVLLAILIAFVLVFPVVVDRSGSQLIFYGVATSGLPMWVILPVVFVAVAVVMATIA